MSDFPEKAKDEVNTLAVVAIGLSTVAILWASVLALQAFFMNSEGEIAAQQAENGRAAIVRGLKAEHKADLGRTTYADAQKRKLKRLDIKHAKAVVVRDAQKGKIQPTSLIPELKLFNSKPDIDLDGKKLERPKPPAPADGGAPPVDGIATPPTEGAAPTAPADGSAVPVEAVKAPTPATPAPAAARPGGQ